MLQGHDPAQPGRHWWFTPGGGLEGAETHREAAARELAEETGFAIAAEQLVGPVWERSALFDFMETPFVQHEEFFLSSLASDAVAGSVAWTVTEADTIDESRWFSLAELNDVTIEIFPNQLRELLTTVTPWNGQLRHLGEEHA